MEERVKKILDLLDEKYGIIKCYLNYENTVQLLVATILSARCTDDMVNKVTESPAISEKSLCIVYTFTPKKRARIV